MKGKTTNLLDVQKVRKDFPILSTGIIYLDNTASSLTPEPILEKMNEYYHEYRANVERAVHRLSQKASEEYEAAHSKVATFINARSDKDIIMTKNTTEGTNIVAAGLEFKKGDKIVTTAVEHHSNFIIWLRLKKRLGVEVEVIRPDDKGLLNLTDFEKAIDDSTKIVATTHISNVLGEVTPVKEIAEIAHDHGALMLVDGAQSVPHIKVDVRRINCDFLAFSGHKMCGPTGSGVLYIREELANQMDPLCIGGGSIEEVGIDYYTLARSPMRFEAGTPAIAEAIGLGAATDYLTSIGMNEIESYERETTNQLYHGLKEIPKVRVYGPEAKDRIGIMSFNIGNLNPHDVALALDVSAKVMVRSGHHCAMPLTKGILRQEAGTVRASTYFYNTKEELERFINAVGEISKTFS
jgi:cysteine desulfurase / selenocysteine lyase